jgi:hypothetical protein
MGILPPCSNSLQGDSSHPGPLTTNKERAHFGALSLFGGERGIDGAHPCAPPSGRTSCVPLRSRRNGRTRVTPDILSAALRAIASAMFESAPGGFASSKSHPPQIKKGPALGPFLYLAESEGFEPPEGCPSTVFKTAAFDHSASSPNSHYVSTPGPDRSSGAAEPPLYSPHPWGSPFGPACGCSDLFPTNRSTTQPALLILIVCPRLDLIDHQRRRSRHSAHPIHGARPSG